MRNRSTGYIQPVDLCTRPVDTSHFLMHHPKWPVATGSKTTCYWLMQFLERLKLPNFFAKAKWAIATGSKTNCYRLMHCLNRLKLPKFYEKKYSRLTIFVDIIVD